MASGYPQGSILGPLLFGLLIHDLRDVLGHSSCKIYADDTQIYDHFSTSDINAAFARIQMVGQAVTIDYANSIPYVA